MRWTTHVELYLKQKHQLGYQLVSEGRYLHQFALYTEQRHYLPPLTVSHALTWANLAPSASPIAIARRLSVLRSFYHYLKTTWPDTAIIPTRLAGPTHRRLAPYIFSNSDILQLMDATATLVPTTTLRAITLRTLIGLLAATGCRPGEAVRLKQHEVNLTNAVITIGQSKGWSQRIVPLTSSTVDALRIYETIRLHHAPHCQLDAFFLLSQTRAIDIRSVDYAFALLRKHCGFMDHLRSRQPRLYDLRHSFVCHRVLAWINAGENVDALMPSLSRYLGHKKISDTYYYLSAIPELMACTLKQFNTVTCIGGES